MMELRRLPMVGSTRHDLPAKWYEDVSMSRFETQVHVIDSEPLGISQWMTEQGLPNAVLNFGAPRTPGGAYLQGRTAQEEDLCCRMPQLYESLIVHPRLYKRPEGLGDTTALWSESMVVVRDPNYDRLREFGEPVNVITAAMPNLRSADQEVIRTVKGWKRSVRQRVRTVLWTARENPIENLILGAWGCGAFRNPGGWVARVFATELASREWKIGRASCRERV
jgi:uncharacterized protein (TIGR02452 family)